MNMLAHEIQAICLRILRKDMGLQVQPGTPYSLSEIAEDPTFKARYPNSWLGAFLATVGEYLGFQRRVNDEGLWVAAHTPTVLDGTDKQVHDVLVVPNDRQRRR